MIDCWTQVSACCNGTYLMNQATYILLNIRAVFWPLSSPNCAFTRRTATWCFSISSAVSCQICTRRCTKSMKVLPFLSCRSISEGLDLVRLHVLNLYLHPTHVMVVCVNSEVQGVSEEASIGIWLLFISKIATSHSFWGVGRSRLCW